MTEDGDARLMERWFRDCVKSPSALFVFSCPLLVVRDSRLCCRVDDVFGVVCASDPAPAGTPEALLGLVADDREDATDAEDDGLLWNAAEEDEAIVTVVTVPSALSGGVDAWVRGVEGDPRSDESCFLLSAMHKHLPLVRCRYCDSVVIMENKQQLMQCIGSSLEG